MQHGVFRFDRSGVIASDITTTSASRVNNDWICRPDADESAIRTIWVRGTAYTSGKGYESGLAPGRKWIRVPKGSPISGRSEGSINVNVPDPALLRTLLARSRSRTSPYRIETTYGRLHRLSPWFRGWGPAGEVFADRRVVITVHAGADGLPRRVIVTQYFRETSPTITEVRFTGWGTKAGINAPRGGSVVDVSECSSG